MHFRQDRQAVIACQAIRTQTNPVGVRSEGRRIGQRSMDVAIGLRAKDEKTSWPAFGNEIEFRGGHFGVVYQQNIAVVRQ